MTFGEKLKEARKAAGFSQEELAEKLNVSRQAITKWETDAGLPDISNIMTISKLFNIPVDDLISEEKTALPLKSRLYESVTEYDIDGQKNFDIKLGGAKEITIRGCESENGEKIKIILSSDSLSTIQQDFKTKIDDIKGRIDINVNRAKNVAETTAKDALYIEVILPNKYIKNAELSSLCKKLITTNLTCPNLEFEGRTDEIVVEGFDGTLEINCNLDMNIQVNSFKGNIEINQLNATSQLVINATQDFKKVCKGIGTAILFEENGAMVEDFSNPNSENKIELNGIKSELKIKKMNTN